MITSTDLESLAGTTIHGRDGQKIGKIVDVYESTEGPQATFVTVATGLFGSGSSFVPLAEATRQGDEVVVPYDKALVKDAPRVNPDEELTSQEEDRLYQHYQLTGTTSTTTSTATSAAAGATAAAGAVAGRHPGETAVPRGTARGDLDGDGVVDDVPDTAVGRDTSGLTTDSAMTRSEERLHVGTQTVETGRAKLRKRIVTEQVSTTVGVSHERPVVISEPITDANRDKALDGPTMTEAVHEVALHAETPVVDKETVAVERVRLDTSTVTENVQVSEQVRKEQIEVDGDVPGGPTGTPRR